MGVGRAAVRGEPDEYTRERRRNGAVGVVAVMSLPSRVKLTNAWALVIPEWPKRLKSAAAMLSQQIRC